MVTTVTSYSGNGVRDWLFQRVTALIIAIYSLALFIYVLSNPGIDYATWSALFSSLWMRISTLLVLLSVFIHAWIGLWRVTVDYLQCAKLRITLQSLIFIGLFAGVIWGIDILWRV